MGIRAKILFFVGILIGVTLIQMGISLWISRSMGRKLSNGARDVVDQMGDSIKRNESARVANTLLANTSDLQTTISEVELATMQSADFISSLVAVAKSSEENLLIAEKEVERFSHSTLTDRLPFITGIGFSFELNGFSPFKRHFLPYAYKENNRIVYSSDVDPDDGRDADSLSDAEKDDLIRDEMELDYYTTVVPRGHNPTSPLPQDVKWTIPYIDTTTRNLMISAVTPLVSDNRVIGVAFLDMALTELDAITTKLASTLTPGAEVIIFDLEHKLALSAPRLTEWAPESVDNPKAPGEKMQKPSSMLKNALGQKGVELASSVGEGNVGDSVFQRDGKEYTLFSGNVHDLFGVMALLPDDELYADTHRALANAHELEIVQDAELRKIFLLGLISFLAMILIGFLVVIFVIRLTRQLARIVNKLNTDADGVSMASNTLNELATSLAGDTAQQAAELASTASSLNQISGKVNSNAEASETCDQAMRTAREHVTAGNNQMGQVQESMMSIADSSEKIANIIKTIEAISFQTNLLALNAAVEASRAGEAGKGFAVVADEVRSLAGRSAQAAKETEELIQETTERVHAGTESVGKMEDYFKDILSGVTEAADWVKKIRESTEEQAEAISTINSSVSTLDTAVKRNEQAAGESASTSSELADQASSLTDTASDLSQLANGYRRRRNNGKFAKK